MLYEVTDRNKRPLCLLAKDEILRQRLLHRELALVVLDGAGRWLLQDNAGTIELPTLDFLPAETAREDFCHQLLQMAWQTEGGRPLFVMLDKPDPGNRNAFIYIYRIILPDNTVQAACRQVENALLLDGEEFSALIRRGYKFSPFLLRAADRYFANADFRRAILQGRQISRHLEHFYNSSHNSAKD